MTIWMMIKPRFMPQNFRMEKNSAKGFDILHVHVISKTGQVPVYRNGENAACFKEMNLVCDRKNVYKKCNCSRTFI